MSIQGRPSWGKSALEVEQSGIHMPRIAVLIVILVLLIGALFFLSTRAREVPTKTIEVEVNQATNAK